MPDAHRWRPVDMPKMISEPGTSLHGLLAWIAGMCADEEPYGQIAAKVMEAKELAHRLEEEAKRA